MRRAVRAMSIAVATFGVLVSAAGPSQSASPARESSSPPCAKVSAFMPRHAHVGEAVDVDTGLMNCGTSHRRFRYVYRLTGPCHLRDRFSKRYILPPGYGWGASGLMEVQCVGRYRLFVEVFHGVQLLDRKVRHMTVDS
jgi:hypothetical protein